MLWLFLEMRCSSQYSLRFVLYSFVYVLDSKFSRFFLYSFVYLLDSKFFKICLVPVGFILEAQVRLALEVGFKGRDIFLNGCGKQHIVVLHFDLYKKEGSNLSS